MAVTTWFVKNHTNTNTRTHNHTINKSFTTWILSKQFFLLKLWASPANLITQQLDPNLLARQDQTRSQSRGSDIGLKKKSKKKIKKVLVKVGSLPFSFGQVPPVTFHSPSWDLQSLWVTRDHRCWFYQETPEVWKQTWLSRMSLNLHSGWSLFCGSVYNRASDRLPAWEKTLLTNSKFEQLPLKLVSCPRLEPATHQKLA